MRVPPGLTLALADTSLAIEGAGAGATVDREYRTPNELPAAVSPEGVESLAAPYAMNLRAPGARTIAVLPHAGLEIEPCRPFVVVALAEVNRIEPKFVSGSGTQKFALVHADGASAIHSAELTSTELTVTRFEKDSRRVASVSRRVT